MQAICSWCGKIIRQGATLNGLVSHGMCRACYQKIMEELNEKDSAPLPPLRNLDNSKVLLQSLSSGVKTPLRTASDNAIYPD